MSEFLDVGDSAALVLVVEDNVEMNRLIAETLAADYRVVSAFDGEDGLAKAQALVPDAIIADVVMPNCGGEELVRRVRAITELDAIPIIMLTARADDALRVRLLRSGAQDYLIKPCSLDEVRTRVANLIAMKRAREALQLALDSKLSDIEVLAREVSRSKSELQVALAATVKARDRADQLSRYKSDFLDLVSHEMRTPLTALRLDLDRVTDDRQALSPDHRRTFHRMAASCGRMIGLVESLLQHARIQSGKHVVERERFYVEKLVYEITQELQTQAERKGLALELDMVGHHAIDSDPRLVGLVVSNLLQNAIKFTSQGKVSVSVTDASGGVVIAVADSGPGIASTEHARIFEPFEQLEAISSKHTAGIGLGLALVHEMLPLLEGTMKLDSEIGRGSVFAVTLPLAPTAIRPPHPLLESA